MCPFELLCVETLSITGSLSGISVMTSGKALLHLTSRLLGGLSNTAAWARRPEVDCPIRLILFIESGEIWTTEGHPLAVRSCWQKYASGLACMHLEVTPSTGSCRINAREVVLDTRSSMPCPQRSRRLASIL